MSELTTVIESKPWVEVYALAAEHGDCIVLSYGDGERQFRLVVDAGVAGTAQRLKAVLEASDAAVWELLVVTHIDLDHIGGTLSLLSDKSIATRFKDIWFNGRQHLELGRESMAVVEGKKLEEILGRDGISWNEAFDKEAVCLTKDDAPITRTLSVSGATITILSPTRQGLAALRSLWDLWEKREKGKAQEAAKAINVPMPSVAPDVEVLSGGSQRIADLADTKTGADTSVTNGSSIAFIFEYAGFKILLGADAHAGVLLKSATKLSAETWNLDVFKLPHHGSAANLTKRLAQKLPARRYLFTTDGKRHETHPSDVAIARALIATPDADLLFNYPNDSYERWALRPPEKGYAFKVHAGRGQEGIRVRLECSSGQKAS